MTSVSSTLTRYSDLKEVSATLDKLKENALKKIRSINDVGDYDYDKNVDKTIEFAIGSNVNNNHMTNQKGTCSKEDVLFCDYDHQTMDSYDLFKSDASNKSKELNDVFEYDFVNMDGCFYNEGLYAHTKQYGRSCSNSLGNLQEEVDQFQNNPQMDVQQEFSIQNNSHDLSNNCGNGLNHLNDVYTHEGLKIYSQQTFEFTRCEQDSDVKWNSKNNLHYLSSDIQNDENHYMPNALQSCSQSRNQIENVNCDYEETLYSTHGGTNQDKIDNLKYNSFHLYSCDSIQHANIFKTSSNDSPNKENYNFEIDGQVQDKNLLQNSYGLLREDIMDSNVHNENNVSTKKGKIQASLHNNSFIAEAPKIDDHNNVGNDDEIISNIDIQNMNRSLDDSMIQQPNVHCEQRKKVVVEDENKIKSHNECCHQSDSNLKGDEHMHRPHDDHERSCFKDTHRNIRTFNKVNHRYVRRGFEDFKGRRKFNNRDMPLHLEEGESQDFIKGDFHSSIPHSQMFTRRPKFNEDKYKFQHARHDNNSHNLRDSRKRYRHLYNTKASYHNIKSKENYENMSKRSSSSVYRGTTHNSRKRLRMSLSPISIENGKTSRKDSDASDIEKSPPPGFSEGRFHRFNGSSGLGGYSPRRRRSEAAIKTPSPPPRSPDRRKKRAWDMAPLEIDSKVVAAIAAAHNAQQVVAKQVSTLSSISPLVSMNVMNVNNNLNVTSNNTMSSMLPSILHQVNPPLSTVTLTQATRSIRRLYVGNVPSTVSDGELMEFMNAAMLSANANHIPGTKPCINCIVNIEKAYAFAEFITPEDATTALGFDGVVLHGTILKIRRPKDFIAPEHGGCPIAQPMINLVADIVLDTPQKIFVGNISSTLTPDKVKEIITAFGQLKSFHWKTMNENHIGCCMAFFEYLDPMVTLQACIGLNGMHLDGQVLTVLLATPNAKYEVFSNNPPFYDIPKEAVSLLETRTNILKLFNLISEEEVCSMEDEEVKEFMEDVRLECKRFGNIRSMQLVKPPSVSTAPISIVCTNTENKNIDHMLESNKESSCVKDKESDFIIKIENQACGLEDNIPILQFNKGENIEVEDCNNTQINDIPHVSPKVDSEEDFKDEKQQTLEATIESINIMNSSIPKTKNYSGNNLLKSSELEPLKTGYIFVEYSRIESACQAAHALKGRKFGQCNVGVAYMSSKLYLKYFGKGLGLPTHEEKQALSLAVQEHLTAHIKE